MEAAVLSAAEIGTTPLVSVLPREIVSPGAVRDVAAGQWGEAAGGRVITGGRGTSRAVGFLRSGDYTDTKCTQLQQEYLKYLY